MNNPIKQFQNLLESENLSYKQFWLAYRKIPLDHRVCINEAFCILRAPMGIVGPDFTWKTAYINNEFMAVLLDQATSLYVAHKKVRKILGVTEEEYMKDLVSKYRKDC